MRSKVNQDNSDKLKDAYIRLECPGLAALVECLAKPEYRDLLSLGSSTLRLSEILSSTDLTEEEKMAAARTQCYSFHIGSVREGLTPLEQLEGMLPYVAKFPPRVRNRVDAVCQEYAELLRSNIDYSQEKRFFTSDGAYLIPAGVNSHLLNAQELEKYRVSGSEAWSEEQCFDFNAHRFNP